MMPQSLVCTVYVVLGLHRAPENSEFAPSLRTFWLSLVNEGEVDKTRKGKNIFRHIAIIDSISSLSLGKNINISSLLYIQIQLWSILISIN